MKEIRIYSHELMNSDGDYSDQAMVESKDDVCRDDLIEYFHRHYSPNDYDYFIICK